MERLHQEMQPVTNLKHFHSVIHFLITSFYNYLITRRLLPSNSCEHTRLVTLLLVEVSPVLLSVLWLEDEQKASSRYHCSYRMTSFILVRTFPNVW